MAPPENTLEPKSREELWKETIIGVLFTLFGLAAIGWYMYHNGHEHSIDTSVLVAGTGILVYGQWNINKKLAKEFVTSMVELLSFWKNKRNGS